MTITPEFITTYRKRELNVRRSDSRRQLDRAHLPIVIDVHIANVNLSRHKFAVPETNASDATGAFLMQLARKHMNPPIKATEAMFGFALIFKAGVAAPEERMLCASNSISTIYHDNVSDDGNLYIVFTMENTFG